MANITISDLPSAEIEFAKLSDMEAKNIQGGAYSDTEISRLLAILEMLKIIYVLNAFFRT